MPVVGGRHDARPSGSCSVTAVRRERARARACGRSCPATCSSSRARSAASAAGRHVLEHGLEGFDELVEAHRRPPLRLEEGRALAPVAHALVDLCDGIGSRRGAGSPSARAARSSSTSSAIPHAPRIEEVADLAVLGARRGLRASGRARAGGRGGERLHRRRPRRGGLGRRARTSPAGTRSAA